MKIFQMTPSSRLLTASVWSGRRRWQLCGRRRSLRNLVDRFHKLHLGDVGRCFAQLATATRAREPELLAALGCQWQDKGATKFFWQYVCHGTGCLLDVVAGRPNLITLARLCLLMNRSCVVVDRVGSTLNGIISLASTATIPDAHIAQRGAVVGGLKTPRRTMLMCCATTTR